MTDRVFVDTNVALYLKDPRDPIKLRRANEWVRVLLDSQSLIVSPQVLNEMYFVGMRKFPQVPRAELRDFVRDFLPACTAPLDAAVVSDAFGIEEAHRFHWWDCVIVASALAAGCRYLLTEDMQHGRVIGELMILNPFAAAPAEILRAI